MGFPSTVGGNGHFCINEDYYYKHFNQDSWVDEPTGLTIRGYCAKAVALVSVGVASVSSLILMSY